MRNQPVSAGEAKRGRLYGAVGDGLLHTSASPLRERSTGWALSPPFTPRPGDILVFRIAGGQNEEVGVELLARGERVTGWTGNNSHALGVVKFDLSEYAGQDLQVRVFDNASSGSFGYILADHFLLVAPDGSEVDGGSP